MHAEEQLYLEGFAKRAAEHGYNQQQIAALMKQAVAAWQRSEGKNPEGGLNAKGRASYKKETGGTLKAPVTESKPSGERAKRQHSFCSRMCGMKRVNTGSKAQSDPDSRINKSLRKWNCKCGEAHDSLYEKIACELEKEAEKPGLWANIRAKRARGEKPAKPGDKDYPDKKEWNKLSKQSSMTTEQQAHLNGFLKRAASHGLSHKQAHQIYKQALSPYISGNDAAYLQQPRVNPQQASASYLQHNASPLRQTMGVNVPYPGNTRPDAARAGWSGDTVNAGPFKLMGASKLHLGDANPEHVNALGFNHAGVANEMMHNQAAHMGGPGAAHLGNMAMINAMRPR
jgi:hypothetical protein